MPNPAVHFEIIDKNQQVLKSFLHDVFDWKITPMMERYSLLGTMSRPGSGIG